MDVSHGPPRRLCAAHSAGTAHARQRRSLPDLCEATPVRMDLSHSGWSDIFFLGMDLPEMARVLNVSIDLAIHEANAAGRSLRSKPICAWSTGRDSAGERRSGRDGGDRRLQELFDFGRDYLGLLKAALIASGIVPPEWKVRASR